jgi:hypothetical protein
MSYPTSSPPKYDIFKPATIKEVQHIVFSSPNKQCSLDAIPTFLLKSCFDILGPLITDIINLSLSSGTFPSCFTHAVVHPLLKKASLSPEDLNNYRPISNLNFISKILEKVVLARINLHLSSNSLFLPLQSAYRKFHSTETALLSVHNDIICSMDKGLVTALVFLDLSAAFDTVDHNILLHRLENWFGLSGLALSWFASYLNPRTQAVTIGNTKSRETSLSCGVPQGSVLGPLLFSLYTVPLGALLTDHSVNYHMYADDTQLYISFNYPSYTTPLKQLSTVVDKIQTWMTSNMLLLNPSKTDFLLLGTPQQLKKFHTLTSIDLNNTLINRSKSVRNLGVIFDSSLSFTDHINNICKSSYFHIRDIRRIRRHLSHQDRVLLANALVSCRLDYCNSIYTGISKSNFKKLQRIQNSLARVITETRKCEHITPVLKSLHWLPVAQRIQFKSGLLVYKTLTSTQPKYLHSLLTYPTHSFSTRSIDSGKLNVPSVNSTLGKRAFSVFGPSFWNSLDPHIRLSPSLMTFRSKLKTYLFNIAFPP